MENFKIKEIDISELQKKAKERTVKTQNVEYDLETMVKRINSGQIKLDPEYQRNHRWSDETASRLIESLILNIPIPTIYLSQDIDADEELEDESISRFSVIDGQQRLTSIKRFIENELILTKMEVLSNLEGFRYKNLPGFLKRRLDERTIKCLRIDSTLDAQVKYDIFERLNSGSVKLEPQELRNAIYRGKFNKLIKKLAKNIDFMILNQIDIENREENKKVKKMEDVELVLRFLSLVDNRYKNYRPNLKTFLSDSMKSFTNEASDKDLENYQCIFEKTMAFIRINFGDAAFAKYKYLGKEDGTEKLVYASKFNAAVYDALSITIADELIKNNSFETYNISEFKNKYILLFKSPEFIESISGSINDKTKLETRIETVKGLIRGEL
ncbi:DUF262 domain-containing protein [Cytobacillus oceanisediminis]|uniref:DUF262 domain-containing protein n=1 Tax=Cytobacillus oceanisediminis TaxID=665099 RepID=UPI0023DA2ACA|nr:DUF262 domain-containing protein [Cytobacillus oceanisediminis]MDF2036328.1 DUF262 domain-containing protein [Cytobacillus oceanisediminis]